MTRELVRALQDESRLQRWGRRALTVPFYLLLLALALALFPLALPLAALLDLARGGPWPLTRCVLFFTWYLLTEAVGLGVLAAHWVGSGFGLASGRLERWSYPVTGWWASLLFGGAARIFRMRLHVEGLDRIGPGPLLLFMRHASVADTLLSGILVTRRRGFALRYVLKRELLWDPCLDIGGGRFPNVFVRRNSSDSTREIAALQRLLEGLGRGQGILIYPEGTRFTPAKRARILERLERSGDVALHERSQRLQCVLPPRLGGALGLLDRNPGADAVFCAHTGFEEITTFHDLASGKLVGREIEVEYWRVPAGDIPKGRAAQTAWLFEQWERVDGWVRSHLEARRRVASGSGRAAHEPSPSHERRQP